MILEICANSVHSALAAQNAGAHRVELCENLSEGGTTPSYGTLLITRKLLSIEIYVLIRPRAGDFLYSNEEFEVMKADIEICKKLNCDGVVIGILTQNGEVDVERTRELVNLAKPMGVTFHRAFDRCSNPSMALEQIIETGCERILTSGLKASANDASTLLKQLVDQANGRISIMPGAGVNANNIKELSKKTGAREFHASAKKEEPSLMRHHNLELGDERIKVQKSDEEEIRKMLKELEI